jgi:hypothetical protein
MTGCNSHQGFFISVYQYIQIIQESNINFGIYQKYFLPIIRSRKEHRFMNSGNTGRKRGRPVGSGKPEGEKFILRTFRFPPELWEQFADVVPDSERSATIREYLKREIRKRTAKAG